MKFTKTKYLEQHIFGDDIYRVGWSDPRSDDPVHVPVCLWNMSDDLVSCRIIRPWGLSICLWTDRSDQSDRPVWPVWPRAVLWCCGCDENAYQESIQVYFHPWHIFGYTKSDSKHLKHNFHWILFVCMLWLKLWISLLMSLIVLCI